MSGGHGSAVPRGHTYQTIERILERQLAENAAVAKAQDPSSLPDPDLAFLRGHMIADMTA